MFTNRLIQAAFCVLVLARTSSALGAQQRIGTISDTTPPDTGHSYVLPPLVVTASRLPASAQELGFATSVVERRDLAREPTTYAARVLTFLPGVSIDEASGPGGPTWLHLRGADEPYTQLLFDGVPINISGGYSDIDGLLLTNVERVEVARGPLSALWGSAAVAGAVQFITRQGQVGPPRLEVLAEGGRATDHGEQTRSELTLGGGDERLRYSAGLGFAYNRGIYALPNDLLTSDASVRLDAAPAERWTVTATARYMATQANLPVRDPGATRVPLDPNQRDRHYRWLGSLVTGWAASPTWRHRLTVSLLWDDFVYHDAVDPLLNPATYPFFVSNFNIGFRSTLLRPTIEYLGSHALTFGTTGSRLALSYGASWQHEEEVTDQSGDFGPSATTFGRASQAVFSELQGKVGQRLSVLASARLEKVEGLRSEVLPRASVVVSVIPERLALRAVAGRAFKAPNVDQQYLNNPGTIPNPNLRPETSVSWEFGASVMAPARALTLSVGYFHQRYNDLIQTVPADTGSKQTNKNLGRTQAAGVEIELEREWSRAWRTGANLTWVTTKILDNTGLDSTDYPMGGMLPEAPRVTGNAFVTADVSSAITTVARVTLVGDKIVFTERFSGQRVRTDPYALAELVLQWHATKALDLYTRFNNLLNTKYQTAYDRPGLPRTVVFGARTGL